MENKCDCNNTSNKPDWYVDDLGKYSNWTINDEGLPAAPNVSLTKKPVDSHKEKVSEWDRLLKKFIIECEELEKTINALTNERDRPSTNSEYYDLKKQITTMKNEAITEAYERKCFEWKISE